MIDFQEYMLLLQEVASTLYQRRGRYCWKILIGAVS
jgi:hypothetical protein